MVQTVKGLTYQELSLALKEVGFEERERDGSRLYQHREIEDAFLSLPLLPRANPVRIQHLLAARGTVDGFGIMDAVDFDLLLLRMAGPQIPAETA